MPHRSGRVRIALVAAAFTVAGAIPLAGGGTAGVLSNGSSAGGTYQGGIGSLPGQVADFPVTVQNNGSVPVTLESATLLPEPGFRAPRLVHLGVLVEHVELLASAMGWPPLKELSASSGRWVLRPLRGYVVLPWSVRQRRHLGPMPDMIEYGVVGTRPNTDYVAAGLEITYRMGGNTYTQKLYAGGDDCVGIFDINKPPTFDALYNKYCAAIDKRANDELDQLASEHYGQ
jgi:hypothetical protein